MMPKSQNTILAFIAIAIISILIGVYTQQSKQIDKPLPSLQKAIILPKTKPITGVNFTDHLGQPFTQEQLNGRWSILFFGFTNCPDICPSTMQTLKQVKRKVSEAGKWGNYQVIMMSVDPQRDSTELLSKYVPYFDPEFIGLRSDLETTTQFAKQLGILFVNRPIEGSENYDVDHSTSLILINPQGQMAGVISSPHKTAEISSDLITLATHFADDHQVLNKPTPAAPPATANNTETTANSNESNISGLTIRNAWIRPAPPTATTMAAYFELVNDSDNDIVITDSSSDSFGMTMIHNTVINNDGVASMQHQDQLIIPANSTVRLAPLGLHMMLMRPQQALQVGSQVTITLIADDGASMTQIIEVKQQTTSEGS